MYRTFAINMLSQLVLLVGVFTPIQAQEKKPNTPVDIPESLPKILPLEPQEALKSFDLRPGFRIELVASEPLIRSPVAIDFDENGRLYVAEFVEYNQYANPKFQGRGSVKLLEDTNGDGIYDKAHRFAEDLDSPVAVACWDGGVFVGVVPDLWYFKDTNGDGKADVRRKVLTGFERDRAGEAMLNSIRWGSDNRFHIATGLAGGNLSYANKPESRAISVRRQNIRFDPRTSTFEPSSGGGQHGMSLNDWGDTFVCDNSNPIQHLAYDGRYAIRNPFVQAPSAIVDVNAAGRYPNLHRVSPPEPWREARTRLRAQKVVPGSDEGGKPFGFFTGATGVTVYRGDLFPPEFQGNIFVGEVANNLVYRAKLEPKGTGWSAVRAEDGREFLASRDVWFRPVQFANAPDGSLFIVDMYRELIEGAAFLPPQLLKLVNVAGGLDRGRIYRVVPTNANLRKPAALSQATSEELVSLLEHPNGWHRDTAARLLYQRQDRTVVESLKKLATKSQSPQGRAACYSALEGLNALDTILVRQALADPDPRVREHALRLAERFSDSPTMRAFVGKLTEDSDPRVRLQLCYTIGLFTDPGVTDILVALARRDGENSWVRLGVLCSVHNRAGMVFSALLQDADYRKRADGKILLNALAAQIGAANQADQIAAVMAALNTLPENEKLLASDIVWTLVAKLPATGRARLANLTTGQAGKVFADMLSTARKNLSNPGSDPNTREAAIRTLGLAPLTESQKYLEAALQVAQPQSVQLAALEVLTRYDDARVPRIVLERWGSMSPTIRTTAAETLLSRTSWVHTFLDAVEKGTVKPADLDPARVQLLQKSADERVRTRSAMLFKSSTLSKRADVIAKYQGALKLEGDPKKGKEIFTKSCSACHKLENVGNAVGADLAAIKNRGLEAVLTNILDPNREVLPQYFSYLLNTDAGVSITGMITAESANTITIRRADGTSETIQRINIESLRSTGLSAMPEGLELQIDPQGMADLLAYLNSIK